MVSNISPTHFLQSDKTGKIHVLGKHSHVDDVPVICGMLGGPGTQWSIPVICGMLGGPGTQWSAPIQPINATQIALPEQK